VIKFYYNTSPNPSKVALMLEEAGLAYDVVPVDVRKGQQFSPEFLAINPNAKVPALIDGDAIIFDSNAILLYLADKTGKFLPENSSAARGELLSWLMFIATGIGPYSGQAVHFKYYAPGYDAYAVNRYIFEVERHWKIVDDRLSTRRYLLGDTYTIADMALGGWSQAITFILGEAAWTGLPNVKRLSDETNARPAVARVHELAARYKTVFKEEMDKEARDYMFPQNKRLAAG
jgi:GST-like protein